MVEDVQQRKRILRSVHDESHFGMSRTRSMISSKYYWQGMNKGTESFASYYSLNGYNCT